MIRWLYFIPLMLLAGLTGAYAQGASAEALVQKDAFADASMLFFRKVISRADGERCPMYPSCTRYSRQAFGRHGFFIGWMMTSDRLLRCGRDEKGMSPTLGIKGEKRIYDPLENNDFWWYRERDGDLE